MKEISCKLLVIGAGPGGYVCAIRAGQLGLDTVIVEASKPGGTCLNVGCIPSKALIHAAEEFEKATHFAGGKKPLGISVSAPEIDLSRTVAWKDGIVGRLTGGVAGLLKRAKVKIVVGQARFRDGKTVEVATEVGLQVIRAEIVVIATGSASGRTAVAAVRGQCDFVHAGPRARSGPGAAGGGRRRLYRAGAGHRLCEDGREGDRGGGGRPHPAALRRRTDEARRKAAFPARHRCPDGAPARKGSAPRARWRSRPMAASGSGSRPTRSW